jgi:hypothetical protein
MNQILKQNLLIDLFGSSSDFFGSAIKKSMRKVINKNTYGDGMLKGIDGRRGQATMLIILAIAIVVVVAVVFLVKSPGGGLVSEDVTDPRLFLQGCIEDGFRESVELIASQGGEINPEGSLLHKGEKIKYLCHSSQYYELCSVQQVLIKQHFENEVETAISGSVNNCVANLVDSLEKRGNSVSSGSVELDVNFRSGKAVLNVNAPLTVTSEVSRNYNGFELEYSSEMYDLLAIAESIIQFEAVLGDSEITSYTQYYPDLIIRKSKQGDGSTIYSVENVVTDEAFRFASRSLAWPSGIRGE